MKVEKTVFISYRRTNVPWALAIFQDLKSHGFDPFFDFTGIASGDFERVILQNIRSRAHFIVLLTPSALNDCQVPGDWLRREVEAALDAKRNIVPLMLEGFDFSHPSIATCLTGSMAALSRYNALRLPADFFDEAMTRLRERYLSQPLSAVLHPLPVQAQTITRQQQQAAVSAHPVQQSELTAQEYFEQAWKVSDWDERKQMFTLAIQTKPDFADAYQNRGCCHVMLNNPADARADFDKAIQIDPTCFLAFTNRGHLRARQGDVMGALADYEEAIRLKPDDSSGYAARGGLRRTLDDISGARADYDEAIRLGPPSSFVFYNRGNVRRIQQDSVGARADYDESIRLFSEYPDAFYARGLLREVENDLAGAYEDFDKTIQLSPDYAEARQKRGFLRMARNTADLDGAIQDLDVAIRVKPDLRRIYSLRGLARKNLGDLTGARLDYDEAIRRDPNDPINFDLRSELRKEQGDISGAKSDADMSRKLRERT